MFNTKPESSNDMSNPKKVVLGLDTLGVVGPEADIEKTEVQKGCKLAGESVRSPRSD